MKQTLQQLIVDFHREPIPNPTPRDIIIPKFTRDLRKGIVFLGMRRCGKTFAMYQHMHLLLNDGLPKEKILYLNFEDDRLITFSHNDFQSILDAYYELYPQFTDVDDVVFYFDEIHEIEGWEQFIRRLIDKEKMQIFISGSSSRLLGKEIATSLRGRTINVEVFPFSFQEHLRLLNISYMTPISTKVKNQIVHAFHDFLEYGGFPERFFIEKQFFHKLLQGYIDLVIYRDIIERYNVKNPHIVREMLSFCLQNCSSLINILNIYNRFKTQGKTVGKNSLYEYMAYFEDAFCIFSIPVFAYSNAQRSLNPKKIFAVDQGLITAYGIKPQFEQAMRFENAVFSALRRAYDKIYYYKTKTGKEIDFVVDTGTGGFLLYQACQSLADENTAKREYTALLEGMRELGVKKSVILTLNESESPCGGAGDEIAVTPLWKWLLEFPRMHP